MMRDILPSSCLLPPCSQLRFVISSRCGEAVVAAALFQQPNFETVKIEVPRRLFWRAEEHGTLEIANFQGAQPGIGAGFLSH